MKKYIVLLCFIGLAILISKMYQIALLSNAVVLFLFVATYFFIAEYFRRESDKKFIEERLLVANERMLENNRFAILVVRNKKILWANDFAYVEFPILLNKREIKEINLHELNLESKFKYNNKIYKCDTDHDLYIIENITTVERTLRVLEENRTNIAYLQIDNYDYLAQVLTDSEFIDYEREIRDKLLTFFETNAIYHVSISSDKFQLIIPTSILAKLQEEKFVSLINSTSDLDTSKVTITFSIGIATNFDTAKLTGSKAQDALELAMNRGGSQVVVFDGETREFYGGKVNNIRGSTKMKARLMGNTILNIARKRDVIYLMTHHYPDSDGLSALLLTKLLLSKRTDALIKVVIHDKIDPKLKVQFDELFGEDDYFFDVVIDNTKKNLLIVVDTQSVDIISHPSLLEEINDKIVIDHHQTPLNYIEHALFNWIEPNISSTTELLSEILSTSNVVIEDPNLANFALLGILSDTNNFTFRTNENTLEAVTTLVSYGGEIDKARANMHVEFSDFLKINELLANAYLMADYAILRTQSESNDVILSICANNLLEIQYISASVVISEIKDDVNKVKIRTNQTINARELIEEFGGGGHARQAAGVLSDKKVFLLLEKLQSINKE